jgi:hypothetical protein
MTPDQQIALASVITSGTVALAAVGGIVWTGHLDRRDRRKESRISRQQPRLERTYLELATYVHRRRLEADAIRPFMTVAGQQAPRPVTPEEIERVRSLVMSTASDEVRDIIDEFNAALGEISNADATLSGMEHETAKTGREANTEAWGGTERDYDKRIADAKAVLHDIDERRLHEQVRRELGET